MANEIRRRFNFQSGRITDNPLTSGATTLNSAELAAFPAVGATEYAVLVLNPTNTNAEIIYVTAHTGAATSATVVRGREGSTAQSWVSTAQWVHVATRYDWTEIGDDNDEPSGTGLPYEGQQYIDTTNDEVQIYSGSAWITKGSYGAWLAYTPTLTNGTLGNGTIAGRSWKSGRMVVAQIKFTLGSSSAVSTAMGLSLPYTAAAFQYIGLARFTDTSAGLQYTGTALTSAGSPTVVFPRVGVPFGVGSYIADSQIASTVPMTWASGDICEITIAYESTS